MHHGIKGMVYDENNNPVGNAEVAVAGINHDVTSGEKGLEGCQLIVTQMWLFAGIFLLLNCRV